MQVMFSFMEQNIMTVLVENYKLTFLITNF